MPVADPIPVAFRIERRGSKWVVLPESGDKVLGEHDTKEAAEAQLRAIEAAKARGASRNSMTRALTVPAWRFSVSTGKWDQFAKFGTFEKDGTKVIFDERTLGQMVENFARRQNDLGMDYEHQALNAPMNGQPAPALAWYSALALVSGGKLARFATHDEAVAKPDATGLDDGLYGFRSSVTPLGEKLLPGYRYISPAFAMEGSNETGREVGYDLLNVAATNTPFLDGMASIQMTTIGLAAAEGSLHHAALLGELSTASGAPSGGATASKEIPMNEEMLKKFGATSEEQKAALKKFGIAEDAKPEDVKPALKKFADGCVQKMADPDAPNEALESAATDLMHAARMMEEPEGAKYARMAARMGFDVDPGNWAQNAAVHIKTGNSHDGKGDTPIDEKRLSAIPEDEEKAKAEMAKAFGVEPKAITFRAALTHMQAKTVPAAEVAALKEQVQVMSRELGAHRDEQITDAAKGYVRAQIGDGRADAKAEGALVQTYSRAALEAHGRQGATREAIAKAGEAAIEPFLLTRGTLTLGRRLTSGGHPIGKPEMPVTTFEADSPEAVEAQIVEKARELQKTDKTLTFAAATERVLKSDRVLEAQYRSLRR